MPKVSVIVPSYAVEVFETKYPGVRFLGYVEVLSDALKDSIMIVPITIGSGIRMKILEACSNGIPFVSTTVGAEGIPVVDGRHCYIADDPQIFVQDIIKLQSADIQKQFVANCHSMIDELYSMDALKCNREEIYRSVLLS